jgi:hypothetical protein
MIQFSGSDNDGKRFIGIGLSAENVRRIREGDPAVVDLTPHGFAGAEVVIFYGRTEQEMEAMVRQRFVVGTQ